MRTGFFKFRKTKSRGGLHKNRNRNSLDPYEVEIVDKARGYMQVITDKV